MAEREQEEFLGLYDTYRVTDQLCWYRSRADEYRDADRQGFNVVQGLLSAAAVCGVAATAGFEPQAMGITAAVLSALATLVTGWTSLMGFRENAELYEAAAARLAHARPDRHAAANSPQATVQYVDAVEGVLLGEVQGWSEKWAGLVTPTTAEGSPPEEPTPPS